MAGKKQWDDMSHERKKSVIEREWPRGLSDEKIADKYGANKGQIVGFRHRHIPHLTGKQRSELSPEDPEKKPEKPAKFKAPTTVEQSPKPVPVSEDIPSLTHVPSVPAPTAPIRPSDGIERPSDEEITAALEQTLAAEVRELERSEIPSPEPPVPPPASRPQPEKKPGTFCEWPLRRGRVLVGRGLRAVRVCGMPCADSLCEEHQALVGTKYLRRAKT